jgi:hypothetical protein
MTTLDRAPAAVGRRLAALRASPRRALVVLLLAALGGVGIGFAVEAIATTGGRVFENPACVPQPTPVCGPRSDVFPRLVGARVALVEGESPYGERQFEVVSRYLGPESANNQRFYYPLYLIWLLAPLLVFSYSWAGTIFTWITALALLVAMAALVRLGSRGRVPWGICLLGAGLLFALSRAVGSALDLQQPSLLYAALQGWFCVALIRGRHVAAGILLALTLVKPQFALLPAIVGLAALVRLDPRRWRGVAAFAATIGALGVASFAAQPGWLGDFLDQSDQYRAVNPVASVFEYLGAGTALTALVSVLVGLVLVAGALRARRDEAGAVDAASYYLGAAAFALLIAPRIPAFVETYDHQALLLAACLLGGRAATGRGITTAALALLVPVVALVTYRWLGRWDAYVDRLGDGFDHLRGLAVPPQFQFGETLSDQLLGTLGPALLTAVVLGLAVAALVRAGPLRWPRPALR